MVLEPIFDLRERKRLDLLTSIPKRKISGAQTDPTGVGRSKPYREDRCVGILFAVWKNKLSMSVSRFYEEKQKKPYNSLDNQV